MTTAVGTWTQHFHVYVRPARTGWRRLIPRWSGRIGVVALELPVHAEADDGGDVAMTLGGQGELIHALAEGLRALADDADRVAAEEVSDGR